MEVNMSADEVLTKIIELRESGEILNKKKVKLAHPDLMKSALIYFPSWEHAILNAEAVWN